MLQDFEDGYCLNLKIISFYFFVLLIANYMYLSKNGNREPPYTDIKRLGTSVPYCSSPPHKWVVRLLETLIRLSKQNKLTK
jgi:hypothetical protein